MRAEQRSFPIVGHIFEADFGEKSFHLFYENEKTLILTDVRGPDAGKKQVLAVNIVELRPKLYMVTWQESNNATVTDIEDYEKHVVYANLTTRKDNFLRLVGTLKRVK